MIRVDDLPRDTSDGVKRYCIVHKFELRHIGSLFVCPAGHNCDVTEFTIGKPDLPVIPAAERFCPKDGQRLVGTGDIRRCVDNGHEFAVMAKPADLEAASRVPPRPGDVVKPVAPARTFFPVSSRSEEAKPPTADAIDSRPLPPPIATPRPASPSKESSMPSALSKEKQRRRRRDPETGALMPLDSTPSGSAGADPLVPRRKPGRPRKTSAPDSRLAQVAHAPALAKNRGGRPRKVAFAGDPSVIANKIVRLRAEMVAAEQELLAATAALLPHLEISATPKAKV